MTIRNLDELKAFSTGSELWFLPDLESSRWSRKIDWYLNFQLAGAQVRKAQPVSIELNDIANLWNFEIQTPRVTEKAPLLVASRNLLPNEKTVMIPLNNGLSAMGGAQSFNSKLKDARAPTSNEAQAWVQRCILLWSQLKRPSVRLFLPDGMKSDQIEDRWFAEGEDSTFAHDVPIEIVQAPLA